MRKEKGRAFLNLEPNTLSVALDAAGCRCREMRADHKDWLVGPILYIARRVARAAPCAVEIRAPPGCPI